MSKPPSRSARDAPRFNESEPEALLRYIEDVDELIKIHNITNDLEKKSLLLRYTSMRVEHQWKALPSAAVGVSYANFKDAVLAEYPEVAFLTQGSRQRFDTVLKRYKGISDHNLLELFAYKREFMAEATLLGDLLSNSVLVERFLSCLHPDFSRRITAALLLNRQAITSVVDGFKMVNTAGNLQFPAENARRADDRYELKEVIAMAIDLSKQAVSIASSTRSLHTPTSSTLDSVTSNTENAVLQCLEKQENLLAQLKESFMMSSKQWAEAQEAVEIFYSAKSAQLRQSHKHFKPALAENAAVHGDKLESEQLYQNPCDDLDEDEYIKRHKNYREMEFNFLFGGDARPAPFNKGTQN